MDLYALSFEVCNTLVAPCLLLTLMVGPTGTCAYLLLHALKAPTAPLATA
ncbi:MAG: hypothetical protein K9N47_29340 [Prosthecobacter sp.]|nr:hypothetical protein [Prosthecobacter sp.]MCF7790260.1 hypothetical protein [Prosthecobacter sp.]